MLSEITGVPVQPNKAITGRNAFAHEAGIHQDGVLKNPLTYEIMTPKSVGVPDSKLVLGKHSGRHALSMRCEQLGYQFDRRALDDVYRRFVRLADKIKHVDDHHLLELIRDTHKPKGSATPLIEPIVPANAAVVNAPAAGFGSVRTLQARQMDSVLLLLCLLMLIRSRRSRKTIYGAFRGWVIR